MGGLGDEGTGRRGDGGTGRWVTEISQVLFSNFYLLPSTLYPLTPTSQLALLKLQVAVSCLHQLIVARHFSLYREHFWEY